jgi:superfamily II DNA helicase RecQ
VHDNGAMQEEMNIFLRTHKVIRIVDKEHVDSEGFMFWSFRIWYIEGDKMLSAEEATRQMLKGKYKEDIEQMKKNLDDKQKEIFEQLRVRRQKIADEDAIQQNYNIFSDKELLIMATLPELTLKAIMDNPEIKKERKDKYAKRLVENLENLEFRM